MHFMGWEFPTVEFNFAILFTCFLALKHLPNDPKALFRKCQAQEKLGKLEGAFRDARTLLQIEPKVFIQSHMNVQQQRKTVTYMYSS